MLDGGGGGWNRVAQRKRVSVEENPSPTSSIPKSQLFVRERFKESARQDESRSLESAKPFLPSRMDCLQLGYWGFVPAGGDNHSLSLLSPGKFVLASQAAEKLGTG